MTYTTLTYNGVEKSLADWGISNWSRNVQNQADDSFTLTLPTPMDGSDIFPYAAQIIIQRGRIPSALNPLNPTLPNSLSLTPTLTFSGGVQWFWGYCIDNDRAGEPGAESFNYKFVGPYTFFFDRTVFQKLQLSWISGFGDPQFVPDWQSDVVLGMSLSPLTGGSDTVPDTTITNLMSLAQQVKEICAFAKNASIYLQANPSLFPFSAGIATWTTSGAQFQADSLTSSINAAGYDLLKTPSANCLIADFALTGETPTGNQSTAAALPASVYQVRAPLDAVNAITCKEAMQRQLQWIGGIGTPVVWTDHSQTPPQLHIGTKDLLPAVTLPLAGLTVKTKIKVRTDLVPTGVHFKYKINSTVNGQSVTSIVHDIAAYISGTLWEGIGPFGTLTSLFNTSLNSTIQSQLMALALTPGAIVQTIDLQGNTVQQQNCTLATTALNLADPTGGGSSTAFWQQLFPHLKNVTLDSLAFFDPTNAGVTITSLDGATTYYSGGAWTGTQYANMVNAGCQVAPWMLTGSSTPANPVPGKTIQARITATFKYQEQLPGAHNVPGATVGNKPMFKDVTLTTLGSGTYYSTPSVQYGEPIPYGLAGYILALETIPQYEGSILLQETEISDVCPIGNTLNLSGGLAAWATMNACVQSVRYTDNGQTEITFGPAKHLGPAQMVQRLRTNMGPRWYNMIPTTPLGNSTAGIQFSDNIAQADTTPGAHNPTFMPLFTNLTAVQAAPSTTLPAGTFLDTGLAATPFTGTIASGQLAFRIGQALVLAQGPYGGNPGESMAWIRVSMGDLFSANGTMLNNLHPYFREIPDCKTISGTPTPGYRLVLCSEFYQTSIRATPDP